MPKGILRPPKFLHELVVHAEIWTNKSSHSRKQNLCLQEWGEQKDISAGEIIYIVGEQEQSAGITQVNPVISSFKKDHQWMSGETGQHLPLYNHLLGQIQQARWGDGHPTSVIWKK